MKISDVNMERKLTGGEKRSKEAQFKKLKKHKKDFRKQYGDDAESVMHAVATKHAKGESVKENSGMEVMGHKYIPDIEDEDDNRKIWHKIVTPQGKTIDVDFTPYEYMDQEDIEHYIKLGYPSRRGISPLDKEDLRRYKNLFTPEGHSPHKKGTKKYKAHMAAMHANSAEPEGEMIEWIKANEGYYTLPSIDRERYDEIPGMDGPIMTRSGKVVYYDPKSGQYYDRDSDMFLTHDEWKALDSVSGQRESRVHDDDMDQAAKLRRRIARAKRAGDIDIQKKAEEELKAIFAKGLHVDRAQEDINEADEPLAILRRIVDNKQAEKIHGIIVDMFTASALVQVYDKVNDENQIKMKKFLQSAQGLERMAEFALSKLS